MIKCEIVSNQLQLSNQINSNTSVMRQSLIKTVSQQPITHYHCFPETNHWSLLFHNDQSPVSQQPTSDRRRFPTTNHHCFPTTNHWSPLIVLPFHFFILCFTLSSWKDLQVTKVTVSFMTPHLSWLFTVTASFCLFLIEGIVFCKCKLHREIRYLRPTAYCIISYSEKNYSIVLHSNFVICYANDCDEKIDMQMSLWCHLVTCKDLLSLL